MKRLLYSISLLLLLTNISAQTDVDLWFVAPDATDDHNDQPIYINLSAYNNAADSVTPSAKYFRAYTQSKFHFGIINGGQATGTLRLFHGLVGCREKSYLQT